MCRTRPKTNLEQSVWKFSSLRRTAPTSTGQFMFLSSGPYDGYFLWTAIGKIFRGSSFSQSWTLKNYSPPPRRDSPQAGRADESPTVDPASGRKWAGRPDGKVSRRFCEPTDPSGIPLQPWQSCRARKTEAQPPNPPYCLGQKAMLCKALQKCSK